MTSQPKGDWDNHGKMVCDALQGIIYVNDKDVVFGSVRKEYGDKPGYQVKIKCLPTPVKLKKIRGKKLSVTTSF